MLLRLLDPSNDRCVIKQFRVNQTENNDESLSEKVAHKNELIQFFFPLIVRKKFNCRLYIFSWEQLCEKPLSELTLFFLV